MNGKRARAQRREARQREAAQVLSGLIGKPGLYVMEVDDDRDEDITRITEYGADRRPSRVLFDEQESDERHAARN
jgi:hypothetical protein